MLANEVKESIHNAAGRREGASMLPRHGLEVQPLSISWPTTRTKSRWLLESSSISTERFENPSKIEVVRICHMRQDDEFVKRV